MQVEIGTKEVEVAALASQPQRRLSLVQVSAVDAEKKSKTGPTYRKGRLTAPLQ